MSDEQTDTSPARYLEPSAVRLSRTDGGFVSLRLEEQSWPRVHLYRAFPVTGPSGYLCIRDEEGKEIGILRDLEGLGPEARALIQEEIDRRYYTPRITAVKTLTEEFGYTYWLVTTDRGERRFTVQCGGSNAHSRETGGVLLVDVDGNRFELPETTPIDRRQQRVLETLL